MAVTDVLPLDEFVDLYKILDISTTASEAELRERVNKLYLEAQRNIDHHNFRKRFYYQQLYEVHLPQAHQLLLDGNRRDEYNRFLDAFHKGEPFPEDAGPTEEAVAAGELGRSDNLANDMIPTVGSATTPSPDAAAASPSAASPSAASPSASSTFAAPPAKSGTPNPVTPARPTTPQTPKRIAPSAPSLASSAARRVSVDIEDMERRRDHKRRELIKGELEAGGQLWGYSAGIAIFVVILAIAYFASGGKMPIIIGGAVLAFTSALITGRFALRAARRNIVVALSKMPYDELLRRCAR